MSELLNETPRSGRKGTESAWNTFDQDGANLNRGRRAGAAAVEHAGVLYAGNITSGYTDSSVGDRPFTAFEVPASVAANPNIKPQPGMFDASRIVPDVLPDASSPMTSNPNVASNTGFRMKIDTV